MKNPYSSVKIREKKMKTILIALVVSLPFLSAIAAVPEGGVPVIPGDALASLRLPSDNACGTLTRVRVEGQPFAEAVRCEVRERPAHPWGIQFQFRTTRGVAKGEVLWARFFARTVEARTETGAGRVCAIFEKAGPPHDKSLSRDLDLGREWAEYFLPFRALADYDAGRAGAGFHLGLLEQTVEIAGFEVYAFGKDYDIRRLPNTRATYAGQAPDAPWRAAAAARIERHRKADLAVNVTDAAGRPLPGAKVAVSMRRHAFGWGSAVTVRNILRQDADGEKYRGIIERHFTRVVFENDLKWPSWDNPANHENILKAADWLRARNIDVRGHCLVWPSWKNTPRDLRALKDEPEKLRQRVNDHIAHEVAAMRGRLIDWDVVNEPYTNHDLMDILGDGELIAWFKLARRHDPAVNLYLNDYAILSAGGLDTAHQNHFEKTLRFLKEGGAPITGLGMQGHFGASPTPPERMLAILDRFAALGLDISITEHDIDTTDEQLQAEFTRDFLTTVFSHPSVVALLTWGFWEKAHWRPNGAYFRGDWSVKPAGQVWLDLVTQAWWTDETLETGPDGAARTRGFLGDYEVTVAHGGRIKTLPVKLPKAGAEIAVSL
jgi:GH35 family endo-1,4-beta-xylanase